MKRRGESKGGRYAAPWREALPGVERGSKDNPRYGPEYLPISPRTGRAVAQSSAERDWAEGHGYVGSAGLWDHERELAEGSSSPVRAPRAERYDAAEMAAYVERHGPRMTAHEWEIYTYFWCQRQSYATIAAKLGRRQERVYEAIKRLRVQLARVRRETPTGSPR